RSSVSSADMEGSGRCVKANAVRTSINMALLFYASSMDGALFGRRVFVAGAGLAGLSAARDLERAGASVTIADARDRVGGRVHTLRSFTAGQHAEAGADLIEGEQTLVLELARALKLKPARILRGG